MPYDFDMTGFVDADHAQPNPRFRIRSVRDRLYRGRCQHNEYIAGVLSLFAEQRDAIYALINDEPLLRNNVRRRQLRFVDDFYESVETPKDIEKHLLDACL